MTRETPIEDICRLLAEHTDIAFRVADESGSNAGDRCDAVVEGPGVTFLVEYKDTATTDSVGAALRQMEAWPAGKGLPLLVVPFMGNVGKALCARAGVAWLDLSGNARITAPRLRIAIEGRPNRYARRGRPSDPFAPKASRITRTLLLHHETPFSQADLVGATGLDKGFVSRVVRRLETAGLVDRDGDGFVRVPKPANLLAAWRAAYDFTRHEILRYVVAARSGPDVLHRVVAGLPETEIRFAATGLAAAWEYVPFATYRTASVYVERRPSTETMKRLGARELSAGANLWLVVPNDAGVFEGCGKVGGLPCVTPLQTYLDLKEQPERAEEAAAALLRACLPWADT